MEKREFTAVDTTLHIGGVPDTPEEAISMPSPTIIEVDGNAVAAAEAVFTSAVVQAAQTITKAAQGMVVERYQLDAAKYTVDRVLGKTKDGKDNQNDWTKFLEALKAK